MENTYSAADFAIARSGAASLSELAHFGIPSLLIPYPFASENHQALNAEIFERAGAAAVLNQAYTPGQNLAKKTRWFLEEPARLRAMAECCRRLAPRNAAIRVVET